MGLISKFSTVGGATMVSRVLGFAREMLIASVLGAGPVADAFYAAFRFPNLFRRMFAEGVFNAAFVPMFAHELENGGRQSAREFAEKVLAVLVPVLLVLTALAEIFMPWLVANVIVPKFTENPQKFELTVELARIMFPYLFCMSIAAMLSGILNGLRHYFLAAFAPVVLNIVLVSFLAIVIYNGTAAIEIGKVLAWGVMLAGFLQMALVYRGAAKQGFALKLTIPRPSKKVKKLLLLAAPVALTGGINQVNLLVGQIIASAQDGAIAILNYADRIYQLPLGVVGIAVGVVLLPELTRALSSDDNSEAHKLQNRSLEFALMLTLPAAVGLFFLPAPIISLLYERGAFDSATTTATAGALAAFAIGLPSFILQKVLQPGYFARFDMRSPMWFAGISALINIIGSLWLFPEYGHIGIAAATSIAGWAHALLLAVGHWRKGYFSIDPQSRGKLVKIILAAGFMGAGLYWAAPWIAASAFEGGFLLKMLVVGLAIGASAALYFIILIISGAIRVSEFRNLLSRNQ